MTFSSLSTREFVADAIVHVTGLVAGIAAALILVVVTAFDGAGFKCAAVAIYASGLVTMLGCSAAYNILQSSRRRELLRRLDRSAIFLMIAGTYTPFTTLCFKGAWSIGFTGVVWSCAATGIAINLSRPRTVEQLSIAIYLALGWAVLIALGPLIASLSPQALALLSAGGFVYSVGVIFHVWESLPFQKAIWHGFVLIAAAMHYAAVFDGVVINHVK